MLVGDHSTVPLTRVSCNTVFSKLQKTRKAGTLCTWESMVIHYLHVNLYQRQQYAYICGYQKEEHIISSNMWVHISKKVVWFIYFFFFWKKKIEMGINFRLFRNECPFQNDLCTTFHKTEVLMVILRFLIGLNFDCFKSYDTKSKYFHFSFFVILYKNRRLGPLPFLPFCVFCHNFCTN